MEVTYTIQMAAKISGVGVHTIRAWEKRYKAVVPRRDNTGHRVYSREDVERLILLSELCLLGYSISKIANETSIELKEHLKSLGKAQETIKSLDFNLVESGEREVVDVSQAMTIMLLAMKSYKLDIVVKEFGKLAGSLNLKDFVLKVLSPFVQSIQSAKLNNELTPFQEQTLSTLLKSEIQRQLHTRIQEKLEREHLVMVICSIDQDFDEYGSLMTALLAQFYQFKVIYLGPSVSVESLVDATKFLEAKIIVLNASHSVQNIGKNIVQNYVDKLSQKIDEKIEVCVNTGITIVEGQNFRQKIKLTRNTKEFDQYLATKI